MLSFISRRKSEDPDDQTDQDADGNTDRYCNTTK